MSAAKTSEANVTIRLPAKCRHGSESAAGHTLHVGILDNVKVGAFRTQENALQQKKNQVAKPQNTPNLWDRVVRLGQIDL